MTTKGERHEMGGIIVDRIVDHYRQIAGGAYRWDGMPDGVPEGFIEDTALFYAPAVGCKRVKAFGTVILPCEPSTLDLYGRPYGWIFRPLNGMIALASDSELFAESNDPCLWMGVSTMDLIRPYIDIMKNALATLNVNIDGLNQPVITSGVPGGELGTLVIKDAILSKERVIPTTGTGFKVEVLDLKAEDHTQNLISTIDWCDARILEIMAASNGVEKASGITTMETVSGVQSILQQLQIGLEKRRAWCDLVNDRFKLSMSVSYGDGMEAIMGGQNAPQSDNENEEASDDAED